MSKIKNKFLIRSSSGEILGPYSKEEVIVLIKKGNISIFDEITEPFKIWTYLENHKDFKKTVQSMNIQSRLTNFLTHVSTKISTYNKSKTNASDVTSATNPSLTNTTNPDVTSSNTPAHSQKNKEVSFNLIPENSPKQKHSQQSNKYAPPKLPAHIKQEEQTRKKIGFVVSLSWNLVIALSLLTTGLILYKLVYIPIHTKNKLLTDLKSKGWVFYNSGNFSQALPFFEKAQSYLTEEEKIVFSSILIQTKEIEKANVIRKEIKSKGGNTEKLLLLRGLIDFYYKSYSKAKKQFQNLAEQSKNKKIADIALINLTLLQWETNQYTESINQINQLLKRNFERDIIWYLKGLNLLLQKNILELESYLTNELSLMDKTYIIEFKQELYFLLAYAYMKQEKTKEMESAIKKLFNQDPFFIEEYSYSSFIAKNKLNWSFLYSYCKDFLDFDPINNLTQLLYGLCLIKTNRLKKADSHIENFKNKESNPLSMSLYAYLLMSKKEDARKIEQVFSLINYDKLTKNRLLLPLILKARSLEQERYWESALSVWKDLLLIDLNNISGLAGVAFNSNKIKDFPTANFYKRKTLTRYPHHLKILPLNEF